MWVRPCPDSFLSACPCPPSCPLVLAVDWPAKCHHRPRSATLLAIAADGDVAMCSSVEGVRRMVSCCDDEKQVVGVTLIDGGGGGDEQEEVIDDGQYLLLLVVVIDAECGADADGHVHDYADADDGAARARRRAI